MRLLIDAAPGELEARLGEALAAVEAAAGGPLVKSVAEAEASPYPALEEQLQRAKRAHAERIQRVVQRRISEIVG